MMYTVGSRTSYSRKLQLVPGLKNHGNNCFFNVIMQSLASCRVFQLFLQRLVGEFKHHKGMSETFSLTVSLAALLQELTEIHPKRVVLSPWKVMRAMASHAPNFSLTTQQDAAEAFLQLVSCLKEEISDYNQPHQGSLVDVIGSNGRDRIITSKSECRNELKRWQNRSLGPCDGILGSILTCQTCSSQISLSFETFQNLPVSPMLEGDSTIVAGCTLGDCLKQFFDVEKMENYRCSYCWRWQWHDLSLTKLLQYSSKIFLCWRWQWHDLSLTKLLQYSSKIFLCWRWQWHDLSLTKLLQYSSKIFLWANKPSCALTQLTIARCPKILCIHLNRVSANVFGDLLKVKGHVSFPLTMDMFPFMMTGVETKDLEEQLGGQNSIKQSQESIAATKSCLYRLVSVVEHFGIVGGGHYTVYRRVQDYSQKIKHKKRKRRAQDLDGNFPTFSQDQDHQWFYVSDTEVHLVSEEQVLGAKAMLLFYKKI